MKVAVVHDWLAGTGGAERVTKALVELYDADVFALVDFLTDEDRAEVLSGGRARTSFIQDLPFARSHFRWYLPLFPSAMEGLDLRGYDLILSASYAVAKGVKKHAGQKHVCYVHTPMRYAWVDEQGYLQEHRMSGWKAALVRWNMRRFRAWDLKNNASIDRFVANSRNVAQRIHDCYGREADVVYPPVDPQLFPLYEGPRSGFVSASRLVPYKRIDRIIDAFRSMPEENLTIIGDGPHHKQLERTAPPNVRFVGRVSQMELASFLQRAKALICTAEEDLGLTPVEAQACGTPVIALDRGGYRETVKDGASGVLFGTPHPASIRSAVQRFLTMEQQFLPAQLRAQVEPFFIEHFRERMTTIVNETMAHA